MTHTPFSLTFPRSPSLGSGSSRSPVQSVQLGPRGCRGRLWKARLSPALSSCAAPLLAGCSGEHGGQAGAWSHAADPDGQLRRVAAHVSPLSAGLSPTQLLQIRLLGACGVVLLSLLSHWVGCQGWGPLLTAPVPGSWAMLRGSSPGPSKLIRASPPTSPPLRVGVLALAFVSCVSLEWLLPRAPCWL